MILEKVCFLKNIWKPQNLYIHCGTKGFAQWQKGPTMFVLHERFQENKTTYALTHTQPKAWLDHYLGQLLKYDHPALPAPTLMIDTSLLKVRVCVSDVCVHHIKLMALKR